MTCITLASQIYRIATESKSVIVLKEIYQKVDEMISSLFGIVYFLRVVIEGKTHT
jgi:hypothetical protein